MTSAPMLVFTLSSFALAAATANSAGEVRSPAVASFFKVRSSDPIAPLLFRPGWASYAFEPISYEALVEQSKATET